MATGILKVSGSKVVDRNGDEVILRGAAIGGWMKYVYKPYPRLEP
jgi:hypothetical protein